MWNIQGDNKLHDIWRVFQALCVYALWLTLGYLFCFYYHVSTTIQNIIDRPVNCVSTVSLPVELPQCGV